MDRSASLEKMVTQSVRKMLLQSSQKREIASPLFADSACSFFEPKKHKRSLFSRRNIVSVFMFLAYMIATVLCSNMSIAIVDMTSERTIKLNDGTTTTMGPEFNWTAQQCGLIFSAFSLGQMIFSVPAGWMGRTYGAVKVTGVTTFVAGALTMVIPALVDSQTTYTMLFLRFVIGLLQVITMVNMADVAVKWFPPDERSRVVGTSLAGKNFGTALSYVLSGFLAKIWRWPAIFYVTGFIALTWAIVWLVSIRESPEEDPWISSEEFSYLSRRLKPRKPNLKKKYPWRRIITSKPVVALCVYECANGLDTSFLRLLIPLFVFDVLKCDIEFTGLLTCLVIIPSIVSMYLSGILKGFIQNKGILSRSQTTTLLITSGTLISIVIQCAISFLKSHVFIIVCLFLCPFSSGVVNVIANINSLELSSEYASIIGGMGSMFNTFSQIVAPVFYGLIVTEHKASQWGQLLCTFSIIEFCGLVFFLIYGSTEEQNFLEFDGDYESEISYG